MRFSRRSGVAAWVAAVLAVGSWAAWRAVATGGQPWPWLLLAAGVVVIAGACAAVSRRAPCLVPAIVAASPLVPGVLAGGGTAVSGRPFGPLAYGNASAAYLLVSAAAGLVVAISTRSWPLRLLAVAGAATAAGHVAISGTAATTMLMPFVAVAAVVASSQARARRVVDVALVVVVAAAAVTVWLGVRGPQAPLPDPVRSALTERRLTLWHEAARIVERAPLEGVGPGRFVAVSPTARGDRDAVAVHNEYLQAAAELGVPAAVVVLAIIIGGLLLLRAAPGRGTAVAATTVGAVAVHASVDYVLHAPALVAAATALGAAAAAPVNAGRHARRPSVRSPARARGNRG